MGHVLNLVATLEAFKSDHQGNVPALPSLEVRTTWLSRGANYPSWFPLAWPPKESTSIQDLEHLLCPKYIERERLLAPDTWGRPYRYVAHVATKTYVVVTFGRNGRPDPFPAKVWDPADMDRDLIYEGKGDFLGYFASRPQGTTEN